MPENERNLTERDVIVAEKIGKLLAGMESVSEQMSRMADSLQKNRQAQEANDKELRDLFQSKVTELGEMLVEEVNNVKLSVQEQIANTKSYLIQHVADTKKEVRQDLSNLQKKNHEEAIKVIAEIDSLKDYNTLLNSRISILEKASAYRKGIIAAVLAIGTVLGWLAEFIFNAFFSK